MKIPSIAFVGVMLKILYESQNCQNHDIKVATACPV